MLEQLIQILEIAFKLHAPWSAFIEKFGSATKLIFGLATMSTSRTAEYEPKGENPKVTIQTPLDQKK